MLKKTCQCGLSIVEILVMLLIAGIIISATLSIFTQSLSTSQQVIDQGKLNRDLNAAMDTMVADIQRAGYWGNATTSASGNPFMASALDIVIGAGNDCITFSYDRDGNGTVAPISAATDDEHYGFRKSGSTLQFRPPGASFTCNAPNDWTNITDANVVTMTAFSVTLSDVAVNPSGGADRTHYRSITLSITGRLTSDTSGATLTLSRTIKIYNNKFTP